MVRQQFDLDAVLAWDRLAAWHDGDAVGASGDDVMRALADLWNSETAADASDAYWRLDNVVVVQGTLYPGAAVVVDVLLRFVVHGSDLVRRHALELIIECVGGWPLPGSQEALRAAEHCRSAAAGSLETIYSMLGSPDPDVRTLSAFLAGLLEPDQDRLLYRVGWAVDREVDITIRERLRDAVSHERQP